MEENKEQTHTYMMLDRLRSDCEYYLGNGNRNPKSLWALNEIDHIQEMKNLYNSLIVKPEWLTYDKILYYEREMIMEEIEILHTSSLPAGYGHKKISAEIKYKGEIKTFTAITDKMYDYDKVSDLEGFEAMQGMYKIISNQIQNNLTEWKQEINKIKK